MICELSSHYNIRYFAILVNTKHKPRASELIKLPNPLPDCIEQLTGRVIFDYQ